MVKEDNKVRIYGLLIVLALLAGVGYGAYFYYNDTQQRIATLRTNNANLESSNKSLEVKITAMEKNIKKQIELTNDLNKDLEEAKKANTVIKDLLAQTDLVKNSLADPKASEARINDKVDSFFNSIESATK
jgi:Tfp pilus assembly protein PilO|tara:strand:+ start:275 stop:667 length:393 start_codon:yes stop_codon:yes gene_type:complete